MQPVPCPVVDGTSEIGAPLLLQATLPEVIFGKITAARLATILVVLGVVVRLVRYCLDFPLSTDEYQLAASLVDRGFSDLLLPLGHNQVAPLGFLGIELAMVRLCGFSELSLRLFPIVCGIGSLLLFRRVAGRLLHGLPLVIAVAIFAVAYYPIRYSAEVKPYASDAFVSLALFSLVVEWWRAPEKTRCLWWLAGLAPLSLAISFPAAFVCGGLSLGIACTLWAQRQSSAARGPQLAWLVFNFAVAVAFLGLMQLSISSQLNENSYGMTNCWASCFPPWQQPWRLISWLALVHTSEMFAYPIGAEHGGSLLTSLCFGVALWSAIRQTRRELAVTVVGWFGLSLIAAALHCYPYGGHARLSQYLAPSICLLAGSGAGLLLARLRRSDWQVGAVRLILAACVLIGLGTLIRDVVKPYKDVVDRNHREFARRFWNADPDARTVCLLTDMGISAFEDNWDTAYVCNQRMYSKWHHDGQRRRFDYRKVDGQRLRCVVYHSLKSPRIDAVFSSWMQEMLSRYDQTGTESFRVPLNKACDLLCYDVYYFEPKIKVATTGSAAAQ